MPDEKEPISKFAARIKAKYPEYKDIDDTTLTKRIVEKYPEYGAMVDMGEDAAVKKKVGSIAYPELESETPSITKTPNEIIGLANEYDRISGRISEIEKPIYSPGGGSLMPKAASRDKERLPQIEADIKASGYDPKEVLKEFADFPSNAQGVDIPALLKEKKENPLSYARHKAAYKWQVPLFNTIRDKDPENADQTIQLLMSGQAGGDYQSKRQQTQKAIQLVKQYVDDPDEQQNIIRQIASDKAFSYGVDDEAKMQSISNDERYLGGSGLNKYQIQAIHFLEDTDPQKAETFNRLVSKRPDDVWGDQDIQRGYEQKAKELESLGMDLERRALEESMTALQNKQKAGTATEEDAANYQKLYSQYETFQQDAESQSGRFPNIAALDADRLAQEALGQRSGAGKRFVLGVGENVGDAVNFVGDLLQNPFRSKEERVIDDLEDLGNKKFIGSVQRYRTSKNQIEQPDFVPDFKKPLADQISQIKEGTLDERLSKVRNLILNNFDKVGQKKNPDAGKFNFTSGAVFNTLSDVGAEIASSLSLAATTGGLGNVSKARSMATMFGTTFATAYTDYYNEAIEKGIPNPTTYAMSHTAKEALVELINNDLSVATKFVNPKSTLAQIAKGITKDQWDDIAKVGASRFSKAFSVANKTLKGAAENTFKETLEEMTADVGGNAINMGVFNEDVDLADGLKATMVNTIIGTLPFGLLGAVGNVKSMNRNQKYALYEAAQNKDKYLPQLDLDVKAGAISQEKADKIKAVIENAANKLNELSGENKINQDETDNEKVDILAKEVQTEDAKTILAESVAKGKLKGMYAEMAETKPEKVLEDIAKQAQNLDNDFKPHDDGKEEDSRQAAEETFGNKLVEAAISLYPKKETTSPMEATDAAKEGATEGVVPSTLKDVESKLKSEGLEAVEAKDIVGLQGEEVDNTTRYTKEEEKIISDHYKNVNELNRLQEDVVKRISDGEQVTKEDGMRLTELRKAIEDQEKKMPQGTVKGVTKEGIPSFSDMTAFEYNEEINKHKGKIVDIGGTVYAIDSNGKMKPIPFVEWDRKTGKYKEIEKPDRAVKYGNEVPKSGSFIVSHGSPSGLIEKFDESKLGKGFQREESDHERFEGVYASDNTKDNKILGTGYGAVHEYTIEFNNSIPEPKANKLLKDHEKEIGKTLSRKDASKYIKSLGYDMIYRSEGDGTYTYVGLDVNKITPVKQQSTPTNEAKETPQVPIETEATGEVTGAPNQTGGATEEGGGQAPPIIPPVIEEASDEDGGMLSGIKKALVSDEIIRGVNLETIGDKEMMALGRRIIDTGEVVPKALVEKIVSEGAGVLTPSQVVSLITYKADIDNQLREAYAESNRRRLQGEDQGTINVEIKNLEREVDDFDVMAVITASQQSMAFRLRKMMLDNQYNVVTQIEKYKSNNDGYIPPEVEAKFRELDEKLKDLKEKIAEEERKQEVQEAQDAVNNIKEDVEREMRRRGPALTDEAIEQRLREGVQSEITRLYEQLPKEKKKGIDKAISAIQKLRRRIRGQNYSDATGMIAIVDSGLATIENALKLGAAVADAIELGINKIKELADKKGIKDFKESEFRKDMLEGFEAEGVSTKKVKDQPVINEDGTVAIPNQMLRDLVEKGVTDINDLVDAVHEKVKKELPEVTKRQVRDYITGYGKTINPTADQVQQQINTAKRVGRLLSELEDVKNKIKKEKNPSAAAKLSQKERDLKKQIKALSRDIFGKEEKTDEQRLADAKTRVAERIDELTRKIKNKDFAKPVKKLAPTDTELVKLNTEKEKLQEEFDKEQYKVALKNRTWWQKTEDVLLEVSGGVVRGLVASFDVSAVFVQGVKRLFIDLGKSGFQLLTMQKVKPNRSFQAVGVMFNSLFSKEYSDNYLNKVKASPAYPLMQASKLAIDDKSGHVSVKEGLFISNWVNLIWDHIAAPIITLPVSVGTLGNFRKAYNIAKAINPYAASQRAFDGYVNSVRVNSFLDFAESLKNSGYNPEADAKVFQKAADVINTTTGRGSLGAADASSKWLNIFLFAPRKVISEVKLYTPYAFLYYSKLPPAVRKKALIDLGTFLASFMTANALIWAALRNPDDDEDDNFWDMRSSDFLTHKIGDKRISIGGGAKSMLVFQSRLLTGTFVDQYGKETELGDRYGKQINTRLDLMWRFVLGKASPAISAGTKKLDERKGLEVDDGDIIKDLTVPIFLQDLQSLYKDSPATVSTILTTFSLFGANVRAVDDNKNSPFTDEDKKDPVFKYFLDKGMNLPNVVPASIEVPDKETKSMKNLTDFSEEKIKQYQEEHKKNLKEELKKAKDKGYVYVDDYGSISKAGGDKASLDGRYKRQQMSSEDKDKELVRIEDLTKDQLAKILKSAQVQATDKTKEKLFPK